MTDKYFLLTTADGRTAICNRTADGVESNPLIGAWIHTDAARAAKCCAEMNANDPR